MSFSRIFFNGNEYNQMWFNGELLWQKEVIDYSQRINLEQVGSPYNTNNQVNEKALQFQDYDKYLSPYWAYFNSSQGGYEHKVGIVIPIPTTVNTEYVIIKGLIKSDASRSGLLFMNEEEIKFSLGEEIATYDNTKYYEFEAVASTSTGNVIFHVSDWDIGYDKVVALGDITIEPIVSTTSEYAKLVRVATSYPYIRSITLTSSLTDTTILHGATFTITPTVLPTNYVGDEIVVTYDNNYLSYDGTTFTVLDTATFGEETTITYSSKLNPSASATYTIKVKEFVPITSIVLEHNLDIPLTDVPIDTIFTITPIITPSDYTLSDLEIIYNSEYLTTEDGLTYTVSVMAEGQTLDIVYKGKANNIVSTFTITIGGIAYPYRDADSVVTYANISSSASSRTFTVIDSTLPYSINGVETTSFSFPPNVETQVKLVNLKPCNGANSVYPTKYEQLRIPNLTDLSYLFGCFAYYEEYEYSWQPKYFELTTNPTAISHMFSGNKYLTDEMMEQFKPFLKAFNTSQVTNMRGVFEDCSLLTELDITNFDMTNVTNKDYMLEGFAGDIYVNKDKWLSDTFFCSYGAKNANFILVGENGVEEQVYQPMYHTEFGDTESLPTWITKTSSSKFNYNEGGYYNTDLSSYYEESASINFQVIAPMTGSLLIYSSFSNADISTLTISNGSTQVAHKGYNTEYLSSSKYQITPMLVTEGETYDIKISFAEDANTRYGGAYIHGFSIDHHVITSISLSHNIEDINNVSLPFTITPTIMATGANNYHTDDLEVIYDSNYLSTTDNLNFEILSAGAGQSVTITYRSKTDNSISDSITFTISSELVSYLIDFTQPTAPTLPEWFVEEARDSSYYFTHGVYVGNSSLYGLVNNSSTGTTKLIWSCYKVVAPVTGTLTITLRGSSAGTSYPFVIHSTTNATQPSYSSSTDRVYRLTSSSYPNRDEVVTINMTQGETYYIHFQFRHAYSSQNKGVRISTIEMVV